MAVTDSTGQENFVERYALWSDEQRAAAADVVQSTEKISTPYGCRLPISTGFSVVKVWSRTPSMFCFATAARSPPHYWPRIPLIGRFTRCGLKAADLA